MYIGVKHLHSFLAYFVLLLVIAAIASAIAGRSAKRPFDGLGRKLALFGLVAAHLQLLIGLLIYFVSPLGIGNFSGANMGNSTARLYMLEHPLMMIIGIVLITIGFAKAKRATVPGKGFHQILVWYTIALALMLSRIPWSVWPVAG